MLLSLLPGHPQQLGLQVEYKENTELRSFAQKTAALAFVPLRFVRLGWTGVKATAPAVPGVDGFIDYFESTWLHGIYPPAVWNVHDLGDCCTNNHIEGWHSRLKKVVGKSHPNVYEIVRTFKMEQVAVEVAIAQLQGGARPPSQSRVTVDKNRKISELKRRFADNAITLQDYISGLAGHTNLVV